MSSDGQAAPSADRQPRFTWVPGSVGAGPVALAGPVPASAFPVSGAVPGGGPALLDQQALLEALAAGGFMDGREEDQDEALADELAALEDGRMGEPLPAGQVAALAVEHMAPGPAMAGWLGAALREVASLDENSLVGVVISARQLTSWAQAAELAAVAQLTSRAAAADKNIGVRSDGRPARVCRDATGQVSLALMMSDYAAAVWADLAITLSWRLPATGDALAAGRIDLYRARRIADATSVLCEQKAREVEAKILPGAGQQTPAQLRKRLRRAVIAADPAAAERRRADAERRAAVNLYADEDGTATLAATGLPAVPAAAAMAKITAIAQAMKAAGQAGGMNLHRAQAMLGLLLGTLPPIPPAEGSPPDQPPSDDDPGDNNPGDSNPGDSDPGDDGSHDRDRGPGADGGQTDDVPFPGDEDAPADDGPDDTGADDPGSGCYAEDEDDLPAAGPEADWPELGVIPPALARPATEPDGRPVPGLLDVTLPWTTLAGQSASPGILGRIGPVTPVQARQLAAAAEHDPAAQWRIIVTNAAGQAIAVTRLRRRRSRAGPGPARDGPPPGAGLVGRATLIISQDTVAQHAPARRSGSPGTRDGTGVASPGPPAGPAGVGQTGAPPGPEPLPPLAAVALRAAARALNEALVRADVDAAAGGCAHPDQSPSYRPPARLREFVIARDVTCRNPVCGQPAWRADLDHTIPYDQGGPTCRCNLGGGCRRDHQRKQHPRWKLEQTKPGVFTWTTPAGRTYTTEPDIHPL